MITVFDDAYPDNLKVLRMHPVLLYVRGSAEILNAGKAAAVIGTREPTEYAVKMDEAISHKLGKDGYVIVSGLAKGCDCHAQAAAVRYGNPTVAVLGQGLGTKPYPAENRPLAEKILQTGGALVSEYSPSESVNGRYLVQRDAWQAGMSDGVISIETGRTGGSLHAMESALKYYRPLGILDHAAAAKFTNCPGYAGIPQAEGLEMYAQKAPDQVYRLFSEETIDVFERVMEEKRKKRLTPAENTFTQMNLFDLD